MPKARITVRYVDGKKQHTPTYTSWHTMKQRCQNPRNTHYRNYGGRGITVCERWQSFWKFLADMGTRPQGMTLDRINNSLGYRPQNCRWASRKEQAQNTRIVRKYTALGVTATMSQWADRLGMDRDSLRLRFRRGWSVQRALLTPPRRTPGSSKHPQHAP